MKHGTLTLARRILPSLCGGIFALSVLVTSAWSNIPWTNNGIYFEWLEGQNGFVPGWTNGYTRLVFLSVPVTFPQPVFTNHSVTDLLRYDIQAELLGQISPVSNSGGGPVGQYPNLAFGDTTNMFLNCPSWVFQIPTVRKIELGNMALKFVYTFRIFEENSYSRYHLEYETNTFYPTPGCFFFRQVPVYAFNPDVHGNYQGLGSKQLTDYYLVDPSSGLPYPHDGPREGIPEMFTNYVDGVPIVTAGTRSLGLKPQLSSWAGKGVPFTGSYILFQENGNTNIWVPQVTQ